MMTGEIEHSVRSLHYCVVCRQVFGNFPSWKRHAEEGFGGLPDAEVARVTLSPGESVPAGARVGERGCCDGADSLDALAWTDIEQGDLVYDADADRVVGIVGHRDDRRVDVERFSGGVETCSRDVFTPDGRYVAVRIVSDSTD